MSSILWPTQWPRALIPFRQRYNGILAITKLAQSAQVLVSHAQRIDDTTVRATLADQFDTLLVQIDRLARDAGCNGVNLPGGNDLTITMNEDGSSSLVVKSFNDTADGDLAINMSLNNWATNPDIQAAADSLKAAVVTLRLQGAVVELQFVGNRDPSGLHQSNDECAADGRRKLDARR